MVLGEAKSGKSTFINAYLGKEILPMDVRQCTSAIIKINYGDKFKLVAKTTDGGQTIIDNSDEIIKFLKIHASIDDKYRNIPVPTINNELLIKYGKQGKEISDKEIEEFTNVVEKDNIYGISSKEYNEAVKNYIKEKMGDWGEIITEIDITYKLHEKMKDITIIDSPGIGAGGNFGEIAEKYIENANAIIFVKSLKGQALESKQFISLIRSNASEKQKEFLFLVFTGKSSDLSQSEFNSLKEQAKEMYKNDIEEEKILFVDSKIQLFLNKCNKLKTPDGIDQFFENLGKEGNNFQSAELCWLKSKGDVRKFEDSMIEKSDFRSVNIAIEKFAQKANYLSLKGLLENIKNEYENYKNRIFGPLNTAKENVKDPAKLKYEINKKLEEVDNSYNDMNTEVDRIEKKYKVNTLDSVGDIKKKSEEITNDYKEKLEYFVNIPENQITKETFNEMNKITMDAIDEVKVFRENILTNIIEECNNKVSEISPEKYIINFTETDFESMVEELKGKEEISGYKDTEKQECFKKYIEKVPYYHRNRHVNKVAENIKGRIDKIILETKNNIIDYIDKCLEKYQKKLTDDYKRRKLEYENLSKEKNNNDEIIAQIKSWEENLSIMEEKIKEIEELKGEILKLC